LYEVRYAIFWDITQRMVVIPYRHCGTTYWSRLQGLGMVIYRRECVQAFTYPKLVQIKQTEHIYVECRQKLKQKI